MNPSSQPENREQQIEEIVRDYDTWCLCDCDECPNSYNYKRAIEAIDRLVTEARINELKNLPPYMIDTYPSVTDRIAQLSNPIQRIKGDPNKLPTQAGTVIQFELEGLTIDAIVDDDNIWGVSSRVNGYRWLPPEELLEACGGKYTVIAPLTPTQEKESK